MKKIYTLLFFLSSITAFGQNMIALVSNGTTTFYENINDAIVAAVDNDIMYLPGGSFTPASSVLTLTKNIDVYGVGHYPDSTVATGQTIVNGFLVVLSGASGGSVQGIYFTGGVNFGTDITNGIVNGFSFSRNYVAGNFSLSFDMSTPNPMAQNINLAENVFKAPAYLASAKNMNIAKNIFEQYILKTDGQVVFSNNIFLIYAQSGCYSTPTFHDINGAIFYNNIVHNVGCSGIHTGSFTGNAFYNNLFSTALTFPYNGNSGTSNITSVNIDDIYVQHTYGTFSYLNDYQLKATCAGVGAGSDGTDIGLFGTLYPYKAGAVPANPHVSSKSIAPQTNSQGELNINISVGAQEY